MRSSTTFRYAGWAKRGSKSSRPPRLLAAWLALAAAGCAAELPPNQWVEIVRDPAGARRGSALRHAGGQFLLWGFMDADPDLPQEQPLAPMPEYDVAAFDEAAGRWRNHLPAQMEREWTRRLPLAYVPRTYAGITTGSERTVMRVTSDDREAVPRPDLNILFDQSAERPSDGALYCFTGGVTAAYDPARRRWRDLRPAHKPPPVLGGSLAYDPLHDEMILFGGGHVAERGPDGVIRGYTGTSAYGIKENDWRPLKTAAQPPPRMVTRMVTDTRRNLLIVFGGDGQTHYLADTWIFDLRTREWRVSRASAGPAPRAGHFTVYDAETGLVLVGGGYNRRDLTDMWAYDPGADRWTRTAGEVPTGFYLSADIAPAKRLILLAANSQTPGDRTSCNVLFPVRTTFAYRIAAEGLLRPGEQAVSQKAMPKRPEEELAGAAPDQARAARQAAALKALPVNQWVALAGPGREAPTRTWGSATFDPSRRWILYWGGGHCGYEGSDTDAYDVAAHTWIPEPAPPAYPERLWNHGVRPAGVTFDAQPWMDHGRRTYAYDAPGDRMVMVRPIRLTTGYLPEWLRGFPEKDDTAPDALVTQPSSSNRSATWVYDLGARRWKVLGPAPAGLDTLEATPLGAIGVNVNWRGRLNDAGYQLPWRPSDPPEDNALFLLKGTRWERLGAAAGPSPQNLYEMTSLAFDTRRSQVILHGAGARRDELWVFDMKSRRWENRRPRVAGGGDPPTCGREAVYIPSQDVFLTYGAGSWAYFPAENLWRKLAIPDPPGRTGQNRAMVYDAAQDAVLLVLGAGGDEGRATVYALRFRGGS